MNSFILDIKKLIEKETKLARLRFELIIKQMLKKIIFLVLSTFLLIFGLYMILLSIFFSLGDLGHFVSPAIIDGLISIALAIFFMVISFRPSTKDE